MLYEKTIIKFNEVNDTAAQQKKNNEITDLIDDIKDEDDPFRDTFKPNLNIFLLMTMRLMVLIMTIEKI